MRSRSSRNLYVPSSSVSAPLKVLIRALSVGFVFPPQIQNDDVSQQLLLNRRTAPNGESSVFAAELEKFTPFKVRVTGTIDHQQKTLEELGQRMDKLGRLHGVGKTMKDWEKAKRAVAELSAKLEGDVGDYREVRRASKWVFQPVSFLA